MSLRPSEVMQISGELSSKLAGAFVQKAWVPDASTVLLEFRIPGQSVLMGFSIRPDVARIELMPQRPLSPQTPLPFQSKLRSEVVGAKFLQSDQLAPRKLLLRFERKGQPLHLLMEMSSPGFFALFDAQHQLCAVLPQSKKLTDQERSFQSTPLDESLKEPSRLQFQEGAYLPFAQSAFALFSESVKHRQDATLRKQMIQPLKSRLARIERTMEKVRSDAEKSETAAFHRQTGELLFQNLQRVKRGDTTVTLTCYLETGPVEQVIVLKPNMTPKEQAEWHLHQYRRLLRAKDWAHKRMHDLEQEREALQRKLKAALEAELPLSTGERPLPQQPAAKVQRARPFREYRSVDGTRIWVGKNAAGNDALTFREARPHQVWFHVRGMAGSHVVVALEKHQPLLPEVMLDAATLALFHSEAKGEPRGEVSYTPIKYLRKLKGGMPGQVTYSQEKTVWVRVEPLRLERLLKTDSNL